MPEKWNKIALELTMCIKKRHVICAGFIEFPYEKKKLLIFFV